jgi:hypothetical protein
LIIALSGIGFTDGSFNMEIKASPCGKGNTGGIFNINCPESYEQ